MEKPCEFVLVGGNSDENIYTNVDLVKALQIPVDEIDEKFLQYSGLKYISEEVQKQFGEIADAYFLEFNILNTLLDPDNQGRLSSFTFITDSVNNDNKNVFARNVIKYATPIINTLFEEDYTLFFHPEVFLQQKDAKVIYSVIDSKPKVSSDLVSSIEGASENFYLPEFKYLDSIKSYAGRISFKREYEALLREAHRLKLLMDSKDPEISGKYSVSSAQVEFHKYYHHFIIQDNSPSLFVSIPILGSRVSNLPYVIDEELVKNTQQGQGVCFIYFKLKDNCTVDKINSLINDKCVNLFNSIGDLARCFSFNYIFNIGYKLVQNSRNEAIKSAKAAIMSRNMSHNLGSHVMAYLKQHLGSVKDMLDKKVLYSLVPGILDKNVDLKNIANTTEMPFLVGLGRFIGYLQERQDYIATVATDYIPYIAPVNLKDAIYDELNPDLRYARHNDTDDKNRPSNILLKYIAKSEGLSRAEYNSNENNDHDIRIGFKGYKNGEPLKTTFGESSVDESMTILRQINFGLPGGLIGRQAIFSIIENIIRNAAKHGVFDEQHKSLELILDVIDGLDIQRNEHDIFEDRIYDEEIFNLLKDSTDIKTLQVITITDNLRTSTKVLDNLKRALNEDYLDECGKMMNTNKGMKEMRISAAWLRHYTDEESYSKMSFNDKSGVQHEAVYGLMAPLFACEKTKDGNLRYMFCVSKCRKAIIVKDGFSHDDIYELLKQLTTNNSDWKICSKEELLENDFDKSAEFILLGNEDIYKEIRPLLSNRIVKFWTITGSQKQMILNSIDDSLEEVLLRVIYQLFSGVTSADEPICVVDSSPGYQSDFKGIVVCDNEKDAENAEYVYRKHHATENDFIQYWKKRFKRESFMVARCVEGITGNNSSDRLVRRELLDEKWYYMHLNAMKRRIAIFDERIFNNEHRVEEQLFFTGNSVLLSFMENNCKFLQSCDLEKAISKVNDELSSILPIDCLDDINYVDSNEELISLIDNNAYKELKQYANNYRSIYQHERGVDIFTVLRTNNGWGIYGCSKYGSDEDCMCEYGKIAEILFDGENFKIQTSGESLKYDYISIHQGLLDKLYEGFNCKNDNVKKLKLTRCLYESFSLGSSIGEYLPNFIIHSGRSKPTEEDMPQKQPFVQYAAIENGVKDCKYSLVELLDYARYE